MSFIRTSLRLIVVQLAGALVSAAARLLGEPKPAKRAAPALAPGAQCKSVPAGALPVLELAPPKLPAYVPIDEKRLDHVRGVAAVENWHQIRICRGPKKGCHRYCAPPEDCSSCFVVPWHEKRPSTDLIQAMERGDA